MTPTFYGNYTRENHDVRVIILYLWYLFFFLNEEFYLGRKAENEWHDVNLLLSYNEMHSFKTGIQFSWPLSLAGWWMICSVRIIQRLSGTNSHLISWDCPLTSIALAGINKFCCLRLKKRCSGDSLFLFYFVLVLFYFICHQIRKRNSESYTRLKDIVEIAEIQLLP